jgi:hypothetical protein
MKNPKKDVFEEIRKLKNPLPMPICKKPASEKGKI